MSRTAGLAAAARLAAAVLLAGLGAGSAGGASTAPAGALFVDDDREQCANAEFVSIQEAVLAAEPGDTIHVCPGSYAENVVVAKTVSLAGAGPDPQQRDGDPTREAVLVPRLAGPGLDLRANEIFVEGFTIRSPTATGIRTSALFAGYRIQKTLFRQLRTAVALSSSGTAESLLRENVFLECPTAIQGSPSNVRIAVNDFTQSGTALFLTGRADVQIENNRFDLATTGIFFLDGTDASIRNNAFERVNNAIRLQNSVRAAVTGNRIGAGLGNGINAQLPIDSTFSFNHVSGRTGGSGIQLVAARGATVRANHTQENTLDGINLGAGSSGNEVLANASRENGRDGLRVPAQASGNLIRNNRMEANAEHDCHDDSVGPGTGGTANVWEHDLGDTANRPEICRPTPSAP